MNDWDKDNLNFLMTASKEVLKDWAYQADEDDWAYAFELLKRASAELDVKLMEVEDDVGDLTLANNLLKKFALQ